ncbi:MAG: Crp/Fnr family transcriptional regulator [Roseobacter sp.]
MELTLESALSPGGMVGHLSYLLLVISMLMRDITKLRILVIASAFVAIAYDTIWLKDPVGVFWESLLVTVNLIQIGREWVNDRRARFSPEEHVFVKARLSMLSKADARRLLNMGLWVNGAVGDVLTTEQQEVTHVAYITEGQVDILLGGQKVGNCGPGNFVGEMSVIKNERASATAIVASPARYWLIPSAQLQLLQEKDPEMAQAFQAGIARDLRNKIISSNAATEAASG